MKPLNRSWFLLVAFVIILSLLLAACGSGGNQGNGKGKSNGIGNKGKITICHKTDDPNKPYAELTLPKNAVNAHAKHAGDIIPAPEGGCPK